MKKIFPGYYRPTEKEFSDLWNSCLFVLDANVLLNLYRYSQETSDELIQILKQISDRLWIPHQAALEYQKNRLQTIAKQLEVYDEIEKLVEDNKKKLKNKLDSFSKHPYIKANNLMKIMQKACTAIDKNLKKLKQGHPDLLQHDNLRDTLGTLLENKIGLPYSQKKLDVVYNLGKKRYEQEIPPGYGDKNKEGVKKYGDLILWLQIIDKAKKTNKPIILVTEDRKEDWWRRFKNKTIGPRPELVNEIFSEAGVSFYLYQTDPFMENAQKLLKKKIKVNKKAIDEVREIRERDEKFERFIKEAKIIVSDPITEPVPLGTPLTKDGITVIVERIEVVGPPLCPEAFFGLETYFTVNNNSERILKSGILGPATGSLFYALDEEIYEDEFNSIGYNHLGDAISWVYPGQSRSVGYRKCFHSLVTIKQITWTGTFADDQTEIELGRWEN